MCLSAAWQLALHCFGPPARTSRPKSCGVLARPEKVQGPLPARDSVSPGDHDPRRHGVSQRQWRRWREGSRRGPTHSPTGELRSGDLELLSSASLQLLAVQIPEGFIEAVGSDVELGDLPICQNDREVMRDSRNGHAHSINVGYRSSLPSSSDFRPRIRYYVG